MRASCRKLAAVVALAGADYHLRMPGDAATGIRDRDSAGHAVRVERRELTGGDADLLVHGPHGTDRIAMRPSLFDGLHRPFMLGRGERIAARVLLALLRLPGGTKLMRAWHARRGR
jgi:hypothetical protein